MKKVSESRSGFRPSVKEFPKWRTGAFRHKNTPEYRYILSQISEFRRSVDY